MHLRLIGKLARVAALAVPLLACVPQQPQQYANDPVFVQRAPPAGRPTYFETIKYIDDGMRYADRSAAFFVSPDGRMCFRGLVTAERTNLDQFYRTDWCLAATSVSLVDSIRSGELNLVCKHTDPQCIREIAYRDRGANTGIIHIVPSDQEKIAIEHLIYLMGGGLGDYQPFDGPVRLSPGP